MFTKLTSKFSFCTKALTATLKYSSCKSIPPYKNKNDQKGKQKDGEKRKDTEPKNLFPEEDRCFENATKRIPLGLDATELPGLKDIPNPELQSRVAKIFQPPKNAMQSGTHNTGHWIVSFDNKDRWENALMGWCSSGDALSNLTIKFSTKKEAIDYCNKNGWNWVVLRINHEKKMKVRSYRDNFVDKRCRLSTK